jgi:predicted amidohydrolase YtcJ
MTDLLFHGGTLLTQEGATPVAHALSVRGGRIAAVGRNDEVMPLAGPNTRTIDLAGRTLIPGFNDAHAHIWKIGHLLTTMVDLRPVDSLQALGRKLRDASEGLPPDAWLLGRGYNEARLAEGRSPTRWDLDRLVGE